MAYAGEAERVHDVDIEEVEDYLREVPEDYAGVESQEGAEIDRETDIKELLEEADRATLTDDYNPTGSIGFSLFESQNGRGEKIDEIDVDIDEIGDEDRIYMEMIE
ncbi:MAG: hypothetical protein ACI9LV_000648 [Candidatus Nanohaloarchaea archaeon]|jgi:hypothetical protein